jgi:Na+/proline symporter
MYDFQLFLASRDPRDGAKVGAAWSFFLIVRWAMVTGIALLALVGMSSVEDPEQVMPLVLQKYLPVGLRGLVIAGLLAAFMSTFSATVNAAASFIVRDLIQPLIRDETPSGRMVLYSRISSLAVVIAGCTVGYQVDSIAQIWNWIMMALGSGVIIPNVLRWYWWRMNGWGYAAGTLTGIVLSLIPVAYPDWPIYYLFPVIVAASFVACVIGSYASAPVNDSILVSFYRNVRPFGLWKRIRQNSGLTTEELNASSESAARQIFNTLIGMVAVTGYYLFPMYLVGHWYWQAGSWLAAALVATAILAVTWYPYLPPAEEEETPEIPEASEAPTIDERQPAKETV